MLVTAALVPAGREPDRWDRAGLYRAGFRRLARLGYPDPLVVEALHAGPSRTPPPPLSPPTPTHSRTRDTRRLGRGSLDRE